MERILIGNTDFSQALEYAKLGYRIATNHMLDNNEFVVVTNTDAKPLNVSSYCPNGYDSTGWGGRWACRKTTYSCPTGYSRNGWSCVKTTYRCPRGRFRYASNAYPGYCYSHNWSKDWYKRPSSGSCRSGFKPGGRSFKWCVRYVPKKAHITDKRGLNGHNDYTSKISTTSCPSGYSSNGNECVKKTTTYICPTGYEYRNSKCILK